MRRRVAVGFVLIGLVAACPARAATPEEQAAAQSLFEVGLALMRTGKPAEACPKLEESQRLDPGMGTQYRLAECYEALGRTASAWSGYLDVASQARAAGKPDREKVARARASGLEPRLGSLVIVVPPATLQASGLEVRRNGLVVRAAQFGVPVPVDPGPQRIDVSAPGRKPWRKEIAVAGVAGTVTQVEVLELEVDMTHASPSPPGASPAHASTTASDELRTSPARSWQRPMAFTAMGLGIAGAGVGGVLGILALTKHGDSNSGGHCDAGANGSADRCDREGLALREQAQSFGDASTVAFAGAAVLGAAAVVLFVTAPSSVGKGTGIRAPSDLWLSVSTRGLGATGTW